MKKSKSSCDGLKYICQSRWITWFCGLDIYCLCSRSLKQQVKYGWAAASSSSSSSSRSDPLAPACSVMQWFVLAQLVNNQLYTHHRRQNHFYWFSNALSFFQYMMLYLKVSRDIAPSTSFNKSGDSESYWFVLVIKFNSTFDDSFVIHWGVSLKIKVALKHGGNLVSNIKR